MEYVTYTVEKIHGIHHLRETIYGAAAATVTLDT